MYGSQTRGPGQKNTAMKGHAYSNETVQLLTALGVAIPDHEADREKTGFHAHVLHNCKHDKRGKKHKLTNKPVKQRCCAR